MRDIINFRGDVIEHFVRMKYEVVLVAPPCSADIIPPYSKEVRIIEVSLDAKGTNPFSDIKYYLALKKIYKSEKPDYIFHFTIKPNIYGTLAANSLNIPNSAVIAGLGHVYTQDGISNSLARTMYKYAMQYPQKILTLNTDNYNVLINRKVATPSKLILMKGGEGVNLNQFSPLAMPNNEKPVFLMVTRLLYEKGYSEYVAAANRLKDRAEFRIMGSLDAHPSAVCRDVVAKDVKSGAIKYIEFSTKVIEQIVMADCIVLPSYAEGLSRALMEALACARPVIASDIAGCRETVDIGVNGFLCKPKDVESLEQACIKFIELTPQQRVDMSMCSRKKAENEFSVDKAIAVYQDIINENT